LQGKIDAFISALKFFSMQFDLKFFRFPFVGIKIVSFFFRAPVFGGFGDTREGNSNPSV